MEIEYPIMVDGQEQDLSQMDVTLYIQCRQFRKKMPITVTGNTIKFVFEGKDQVVCGTYDITVYINEGQIGQLTLVNKEAFTLVRWK